MLDSTETPVFHNASPLPSLPHLMRLNACSRQSSMKFTRVNLTTQRVLAMLGLIVAGDLAVLAVWTAAFG